MTNLISPKYNFREFCTAMYGKHPLEIITPASAEISVARKHHRETTKDADFRKGSKGRKYCDSLRLLISLFMNGKVPHDATPEFMIDVKPLVQHLLERWEIGSLRETFSDPPKSILLDLPSSLDPLVVLVSREEVETMNTSTALAVLNQLTESSETAKAFVERVDISFQGYDNFRDELFEIANVRNFVFQLDEKFPFWLFFLSKRHLGLQCLLYCHLPPFLKEEAKSRVFPLEIDKLLSRRWFPAMNQVCMFAGYSEAQIEQLTDRAIRYITSGRFPLSEERFS